MIALIILMFVDLFVTIFNLILIVRVVSSYFARPDGTFYTGLVNLTEPLLGPVRRMLPQTPGLDLAPLVTFFLLQGVQYLLHWIFKA